jgi:hypothetical protein
MTKFITAIGRSRVFIYLKFLELYGIWYALNSTIPVLGEHSSLLALGNILSAAFGTPVPNKLHSQTRL